MNKFLKLDVTKKSYNYYYSRQVPFHKFLITH